MILVYILLAIILFFLGFRFMMYWRMRKQKGKPAPELTGSYGKAIQQGKPALFYFYSEHCGACRPMTPIIDSLKKDRLPCFKVDITHHMDVAKKFGVMATPSTVLVEKGVVREFMIGPQNEATLRGLFS